MSFFRREKETEIRVTFIDDAGADPRRASAIVIKNSKDETVNLMKRERKGLSLSGFLIILAALLAVLILVEYFGIYRPYRELETREAQLEADRSVISQLQSETKDMEEVRAEYRKYNYENFPRELADREKVLKLLEDTVFEQGKITRLEISGNTLLLTVTDVNSNEVATMQSDIRESDLVEKVVASKVSNTSDGKASVDLTVTFRDATKGGN